MDPFVIPHKHQPVNWDRDGKKIYEPRRGQRIGLGANITIPGMEIPVRCYSLHLEVFCGIFGRLKQFADIFEDARNHLEQYPYQLIFGDLNTMAHGIARFSPIFCSDKLRIWSVGYSEAQWWQRYIFDHTVRSIDEPGPLRKHVPHNLSAANAAILANPHFYDPFCMSKDTTLQGYRGMFKGKLDWTLLHGFHTLAKGMDNHDFEYSDHKLLYVIVRPCVGDSPEEFQEDVERAYKEGRVLINHTRNFLRSVTGTAMIFMATLYAILWAKQMIQ